MKANEIQIGKKVVKSIANIVTIGKIGTIVDVDFDKQKVQVDWSSRDIDSRFAASKTWIRFDAVEDESIPYIITKSIIDKKTGKIIWPKYQRI
jgi:hypothetical protein